MIESLPEKFGVAEKIGRVASTGIRGAAEFVDETGPDASEAHGKELVLAIPMGWRQINSGHEQALNSPGSTGIEGGSGPMRRCMTMGLALSVIVFTGGQALAQTIIDNFSLPAQGGSGTDYLTITGGIGSSGNFVQTGIDAIGGTRVYYGIKTNNDTAALQLGITSTHEYRQVANPVTAGNSKLLYGYSAVNTASLDANDYLTGQTFSSLNLGVTGTTGVSMVYSLGGTASTGTIIVTLISGTNEASQQLASVSLPIVSASNAPLLFSSGAFLANNGSLNFGDIDQIIVSINGVPDGVNLSADNITFAAVPEPTSLAMLGLTTMVGGTAIYYRKRHRRRAVSAV